MAILLVIMLTACQEDSQTKTREHSEQSNPSNTEEVDPDDQTDDTDDTFRKDTSHADNHSTAEGEADDETKSSEDNVADNDSDSVNEESYSSEEEAIDAIEGYHDIEQTNIDLGNGIKGLVEGAAGHQYLSWNEGNWMIEIDFPSDPQYAVDDYEDAKSMAKSIVNYLEDHMLPAPGERGTIKVSGFNDRPETLIRWQQGTKVYEIDQQISNPIEALQIAVNQTDNQ